MNNQISAIAIAWFSPEDWNSWKRLLPDRSWHSSYAGWLKDAEKFLSEKHASGVVAIKANVRPDAFAQWCISVGSKIDAAALNRFANQVAARHLFDDKIN